jgi:FtsP/CotA-like multicopper oxidase with cupredoxin domain
MSSTALRALGAITVLLLALAALFLLLRPSSPASTGGSREQTFDLAVSWGTMSPDEIVVDEGDRVDLRITSDTPLELHLHGYDLEEEVEPDEPSELSFDATITGRFEIEAERTQEELGTLVVLPG